MIVPANRKYFPAARFMALAPGEDFHIDSGLGGSWRVVFTGYDEQGRLHFTRPACPDWPEDTWTFANPDEAATHLYILVPAWPFTKGA